MRQGLIGQIAGQLRAGMFDFGGIVVFYLLLWCVGLKAAIAGTIVFIVLDAVRRIRRKLGFPRIYLLSNALVICFGGIDLLSANPFMIKYEAVISSLAVGAMFALGARGRSIIQELVEQQSGEADDSPEMRRFFQLMTLLWAAYFVVKAGVYFWIGQVVPIERAMEIRPVISIVSLAAMIALCTRGRWLFAICEHLSLLPRQPGPDRAI